MNDFENFVRTFAGGQGDADRQGGSPGAHSDPGADSPFIQSMPATTEMERHHGITIHVGVCRLFYPYSRVLSLPLDSLG
jgi:hypothetical protein